MTTSAAAPDELLRRAAALVFVSSLHEPEIADDDAHHLVSVLRLRGEETIVVADGEGAYRQARLVVEKARKGGARALAEPTGPICRTTVAEKTTVGFALQKGERPEWTVQKLTELGVDEIVPFVSARSVVRFERAGQRVQRLRRIAKEAAAQSRRPNLPTVAELTDFETVLARLGNETVLASFGGPPLSPGLPPVLVGPEGGWSDTEMKDRPTVGLGPTVLRSETAALSAAVLLGSARAGLIRLFGDGGA